MRVLIPTAGVGSRLGDLTRNINKAMIAVGKRPVISHIIDRYPTDTDFVVALGFKGDYLRQYLELAYPRRKIAFVDVEPFEGPGSGPGYTLQQCTQYMDQEFVFHANDSIVVDNELDFNFQNDTMLAVKGTADPKNYRTVSIDSSNGRVSGVYDKLHAPATGIFNYIGVSYVKRYTDFVAALKEMPIEIGESAYFMQSLDSGIDSYLVDAWYDIGNLDQLRRAVEALGDFDNLQKSGEAIYFLDGRVFKFSIDTKFIEDRVSRATMLEGLTPHVTQKTDNFYVYNFVPGKLLSEINTPYTHLESLLRWCEDNLWIRETLTSAQSDQFERACFSFYYDKTIDRINEFFVRFDTNDTANVINGKQAPTMESLVGDLDWSELRHGVPVQFHGDFHFENIVRTDSGFTLLDWRQNFGGEQRYGDLYYDIAKLLHGLIVNHQIIREDLFEVNVVGESIEFDFYQRNSLLQCQHILEAWCARNGYSWPRVQTLTALVFINIAALHHQPYSHLLYYLGKHLLSELANGGRDGTGE